MLYFVETKTSKYICYFLDTHYNLQKDFPKDYQANQLSSN